MRYFYEAPTALLATNQPRAQFHATSAPDTPDLSLVVVAGWDDSQSQDDWEALPGVVELPVWTWDRPVPPSLHGGFRSHGVKPTQTIGEAMRAIRAKWPGARP